jgi:hypothetical protein
MDGWRGIGKLRECQKLAEFQTLREGRIQFKVGADDRRLLDELVLQAREQRRVRHSGVSTADVLIALIKAWCRSPRRLTGARIEGKPVRVDLRLSFSQTLVCRRFASVLQARGENNASAALRAIVHDRIEPKRKQLDADARKREAAAREREIREQKAAQQRQYRAARRKSVGDAIELFLPELRKRYTERAAERVDRDAVALFKLGLRVACHLAAVTQAKERHDPQARRATHQFADQFVRILGFALAQSSAMIRLSKPGSTSSP